MNISKFAQPQTPVNLNYIYKKKKEKNKTVTLKIETWYKSILNFKYF